MCLQEAIQTRGKPDIVNSNQGSRYTCVHWLNYLKAQYVHVSMDGRGRAKDNGSKLYQGIKYYINYYNERRHHQGIQYDFPAKRYQRSFETNYVA